MSRLNLLVAQFSDGYTDGLYGKRVGTHGGKAYAIGWEYGDVDRQKKLRQALADLAPQNNVSEPTVEGQ